MPPKKKDKDKKAKEEGEKKVDTEDRATERELILEKELNTLIEELDSVKKRVQKLKKDNEWLEEEAQKISNESQEYMSYMSKKASMRQNSIVTLSDQNKKEIEDISKQKEEMVKIFEEKRANLQKTLLEKENLLIRYNKELDDMEEYKNLKAAQLEEIRLLEQQMNQLRGEQTKTISDLKSQFLKEKADFKREAEMKINSVIKVANKEARLCLSENTYKIKYDNQKLRKELLEYIQYTKALQAHKTKLENQKQEILHEISYAEDLKKLRTTQQEKVISKLFANKEDA